MLKILTLRSYATSELRLLQNTVGKLNHFNQIFSIRFQLQQERKLFLELILWIECRAIRFLQGISSQQNCDVRIVQCGCFASLSVYYCENNSTRLQTIAAKDQKNICGP